MKYKAQIFKHVKYISILTTIKKEIREMKVVITE